MVRPAFRDEFVGSSASAGIVTAGIVTAGSPTANAPAARSAHRSAATCPAAAVVRWTDDAATSTSALTGGPRESSEER